MGLLIVLAVVLIILLFVFISKYNTIKKYSNKVEEAFSSVDVHLKLRYDLIPNLVNTVKGYTKHEKESLTKLVELRNNALNANNKKDKVDLANSINSEMSHILAIAESYPELKASELYLNLMKELTLVEDKIAAARRFYISNANKYNTLIEMFPNNVVANMFNFKRAELFQINVGEKSNVSINLD